MSEGLWALVAALGLLLLGAGGGGWFAARRNRKRQETEPSIRIRAPRPPDRPSVAPTPDEVESADEGARETDERIEAIEAEAEAMEPHPPDEPDPGVSSWLRDRAERDK